MSDKLMKSIEENMTEREKIKNHLASLENGRNSFYSDHWPSYRKELRKELHALFNIHQLRDKLKSKVLDQEEKKMLWEDFKEQILCFASLTLVSNRLIMFSKMLQELLLIKYSEKLSSCGIENSLEIADYILKDFFEHLNSESLKNMQIHIRDKLRPRISRLKPSEEFSLQKILLVLHTFQKELCGFVGHPSGLPSNSQLFENSSILHEFKSLSNDPLALQRSNLLISNGQQEQKDFRTRVKRYFSGEQDKLKVPKSVLGVVQEFLNCFSQHKIFNQRSFIEKCIDYNAEKRVGGYDKEPSLLMSNSEKVLEQQEPTSEKQGNRQLFAEILLTACCEAMDWFESSSLQTYLYYSIKFEFMKFQNRLSLYFSKAAASAAGPANKQADKMALANYLTIIYRIVQEEFLEDNSEINSQNFYKQKLKQMMAMSSKEKVDEADLRDYNINVKTIEEFERHLWLEESFAELNKRIFLDSEILDKIGKPGPSNEEFDDVFKLLTKFG